jgi:CubicO group peptidase (beta-lactamase class C family)
MQQQDNVKAIWLTAVLAATAIAPLTANAQRGPIQGLDAYIEKAIKDWEVPGLAIAIVYNDTIVHAKGYGVKELGKGGAVTERTLFAIGSASKAFTAGVLATMVDEGKLRWDDPAAKFLPGFEINDPYASRELTIRDLLSHRSGLARGDQLWYATDYTRDEILRRVRYLRPTWSFRSNFGYQNIMYLAAGELSAKVGNKNWDDLVQERLFTPLGMTQSNTSVTKLAGQPDVSTPHARLNDKIAPIKWRNIDNIAPAGSINSNVLDMAQWVRVLLNGGTINGKTVFKPATVRELHAANTIIRSDARTDSLLPETHLRAYGLGWFLEDYRGRKIVHHGGNIDGMSALVWMVPEEKLGVVVLTNMNGTSLPTALTHRITDLYMGNAKRDWSAEYLAFTRDAQRRAATQAQTAERNRAANTRPSLSLDKYTGTYENEMYGRFVIEQKDGKLVLRGDPQHVAQLDHWHYDTFRANWADPVMGRVFVSFLLDQQGRPATMRVDGLGDYNRQFTPPRN